MLTASLLFAKKLVRLADQYAKFVTNQDNLELKQCGWIRLTGMAVANLQCALKNLCVKDNYALAKIVVCAPGFVLHRSWSASLCSEREAIRRPYAVEINAQGCDRGRGPATAP
jgi:hypothetical protein